MSLLQVIFLCLFTVVPIFPLRCLSQLEGDFCLAAQSGSGVLKSWLKTLIISWWDDLAMLFFFFLTGESPKLVTSGLFTSVLGKCFLFPSYRYMLAACCSANGAEGGREWKDLKISTCFILIYFQLDTSAFNSGDTHCFTCSGD